MVNHLRQCTYESKVSLILGYFGERLLLLYDCVIKFGEGNLSYTEEICVVVNIVLKLYFF